MSGQRDDPIVAIATAAGRGGIGVVRLSFGAWSGEAIVARFVAALCGRSAALTPRHATMVAVRADDGAVIDRGIALLFAAPHSYTAEDVLELQLHGGPVVLQMVVSRCLAVADQAGDGSDGTYRPRMRLAAAGEFTERAYLNDKLDLAQAEAVADLIEASSEAAVLGAQASLSGAFSDEVHALVGALTELRALVEATLDFPDEEIDFLEQSDARGRLAATAEALATLMDRAKQGALLREGLTVVLVGRPNVGKSSLLNALAGSDVAIVTPIAGTTRDRIEQTIRLGAIVLHVIDTAGIRALDDGGYGSDEGSDDGGNDGSVDRGDGRLRDGQPDGVEAADGRYAKPGSARSIDPIERIGIARTWEAVAHAQVVLHLVDVASLADAERPEDEAIARRLPAHAARRTVVNKIDLSGDTARVEPALDRPDGVARLWLSAKTGAGIDLLRHELLAIAGWQPGAETGFVARERHLVALRAAAVHLAAAGEHADEGDRRLDLFAEELRLAQVELGRITGTVSADDLLGEIFGRFCIGK